ncbi:aldehyde dehydrogenase family protein [Mycobacteroides abscessus]|uniref:aldehyde dehydrogenase family protein n=1 Tax=Mycobacteroides abscessus TaxID=36809 RepID=UPI0009A8B12B|nr:aldehyde dehydrogenase family protein [Mycobacteroides abscessus]RIT40858.1 aldehyde dehydrogenase family protein [Mycobacteroides abscessus]SKT94361.1 NAD-dependent aldehyde dehydrogenase [Mycobacteroides abscessus subsp. massiliense]SKU20356.1 NAD-dependent aldehyde dehydrogenase [Mycobacteroides abscessus subsp. massiliense]
MTTATDAREGRAAEITAIAQRTWRLLIGGELRAASDGATFTTSDPYTEKPLAEVPNATAADVDAAVAAATAARAVWREVPATERARLVLQLADAIEEHGEELALLDTLDAGSPIINSRLDVRIALEQMRMFAGFALEMKGQTIPASNALHLTVREPVGVVAKIWPYNHPLMFGCRIAAPLIAGNPVVGKPPETAPLSTLRLAELAADIFPPGVVNIVVGDGPGVPDRLVRHPDVRRIGFIGSEPTGRGIQRAAAEVAVKHVTLELGGKNAMVVFDDADIDAAAAGAVFGMNFTWSGQSCGSNSRLLVQRGICESMVSKVAALVEARRIGDPLDENSQQGTMINRTQYEKSLSYIDIAQREGARLVTGGGRPSGEQFAHGYFVAATVLADVSPQSRIGQEEVFGPVLSIIPFDSEEEAVRIANGVRYGLTASVWTRDLNRAHRVARDFEAGHTWINGSSTHFPNVPYGGVKASGVGGKEECLAELLSYTEEKVINVMYR